MKGLSSVVSTFFVAAFGLTAAGASHAQIPASGPDDICAPTDDPCIISQVYDVLPPGGLAFGARTVRMVPGGRLLGSVNMSAAEISIETGADVTAIDSSGPGGDAGSITVFATGALVVGGKLLSRGNPGGEIYLEGDPLTVTARLLADGSPIGSSGGTVTLRSDGDIRVSEDIITRSQKGGGGYDTPNGGALYVRAGGDVTITGAIESGGGSGGIVDLDSDQHLTLGGDVKTSGGTGIDYAGGGYVYLYADAGMVIENSRIAASGATGYVVSPYGYSYGYPGYGGTNIFRAWGGDLRVDKTTKIYANGGPGGSGSTGGWLFLLASDGEIVMDGDFTAKGYGRYGQAGNLDLSAYTDIRMDRASNIDLRSKYGGYVDFRADYYGQLHIDATIDVRGRSRTGSGQYSNYGSGGSIYLDGGDLTMDGKMLNGADGGSDGIGMHLCRLHLESKGRIDASNGSPLGGGNVFITVEESFIADAGSGIFADAQGGGEVFIDYRSGKPPVLNGNIVPSPFLDGTPGGSCAVCGNGEVDYEESCDDGNLINGDNCNDQCQDEGCIAETPGYPGVSLCSDGDACTIDVCDPVSHTCSNVLSCDEGVACTVDSCVASACEHTPDDSLCEDYNECTDDVCNATTGCVHANLDGVPCEDGDLCTVTGDCVSGTCVATDEVHSSKNKITIRLRAEPNSDKLSYKGELPLTEYTANPAITGMTIEVRDSDNLTVLSSLIPGTSFEDRDGTGAKVSFRDKNHELPTGGGVTQVKISESVSKGVAKVKIRVDDSDLDGTDEEFRMSVSMLFGADPALDDCLTARFVPCTPKTDKNKCKDPK